MLSQPSVSHAVSAIGLSELLKATERLMLETLLRPNTKDLNELVRYHFGSGGSRVRARLALNASQALGLSENDCIAIAASCELVHNASLLHDDIQDGDTLRRGREAAWHRFNPNLAMCAGTLMLSAAFQTLTQASSDTASLIAHLHARTSDLIAGQTKDLASQNDGIDVAAYIEMAAGKSGSLLALPLELALIAAQKASSLVTAKAAGESFATAYQIADDLNDVDADAERGNCNIVQLLQATGLDRQAAVVAALNIADEHRQKALWHAERLPLQSGHYMEQLCHTLLDNTVSVESQVR